MFFSSISIIGLEKSKANKTKEMKKDEVLIINDTNEDKYDWGGEKIEAAKEIDDQSYHFGSKKKHIKTPFEMLSKNKGKIESVHLSDKKKTPQKKEVDELEQQLEDLF